MEKVKVLIIGSGPAGYTAAIYTSRANLQPVLYEGIEPGGQLTTTTEIENFPGYPEGVDGNQMMADLRRQAERFGTEIRTGQITKIDLSARPFHVTVDGTTELEAEAVIVATGASAKYLGLPSETKFRGQESAPAPHATGSSTARRTWPSSAAATRPARRPPTSPRCAARST